MKTIEAEISGVVDKAGPMLAGERRRRRYARMRRMRRQAPWVPGDAGSYQDRIARAVARELEHVRVVLPERGAVGGCAFQCVCCNAVRPEEERREPESEVCVRCVEDAGFWN